MRGPRWLLFAAAAAIAVLVVIAIVVWREPVPEHAGTAPSVVSGETTDAPLDGTAAQREPRSVEGSASAARGARGSGIEGVTSGGTTLDPPSK